MINSTRTISVGTFQDQTIAWESTTFGGRGVAYCDYDNDEIWM
jgi:hypothetical protein